MNVAVKAVKHAALGPYLGFRIIAKAGFNRWPFLLEGQRVELNAMTSDQFVDFVERKLAEAGIEKVDPPKDQLEEAYRVFARSERMYGHVYRLAKAVSAGAREVAGTEVSGHRADVVQKGKKCAWCI